MYKFHYQTKEDKKIYKSKELHNHIVNMHTDRAHTCRIAHPVGMKANMLAKMSPTVRLRKAKKITRVTMIPINKKNLRSLNNSWKSALNFFLPMDTICNLGPPGCQ